jgi:hypothetical protein
VKRVTIKLAEESARWARIEAARRDISVSELIGHLVEESRRAEGAYEVAMREYLSRPAQPISAGGWWPKREEVHDRGGPALFGPSPSRY